MTRVGVREPPLPASSNEVSKFSPLVHADLAQVVSARVSALTNIQQKGGVWSEWHYYELDNDEVGDPFQRSPGGTAPFHDLVLDCLKDNSDDNVDLTTRESPDSDAPHALLQYSRPDLQMRQRPGQRDTKRKGPNVGRDPQASQRILQAASLQPSSNKSSLLDNAVSLPLDPVQSFCSSTIPLLECT